MQVLPPDVVVAIDDIGLVAEAKGQSEGVQERDIYRPAVFMELEVGEN